MKKKLRVFRVQPDSYEAMREAIGQVNNVSEKVRQLLGEACAAPPPAFPQRKLKAELKSFPLFMDEVEHGALVVAAKAAGVSKNVFVEGVFKCLREGFGRRAGA